MWEWRSDTALRYTRSKGLIFWWHFLDGPVSPEVRQVFLDRLAGRYIVVPCGMRRGFAGDGRKKSLVIGVTASGENRGVSPTAPFLLGTKPARFLGEPTALFEFWYRELR